MAWHLIVVAAEVRGAIHARGSSMKWLAVFAAVAAVIAVIGYQLFTPIATLRYRLTLEAEVDGKPVMGSGVVEVTYAKAAGILSPGEYGARFRGEAVVLDLGPRGLLFALLKEGQDSRSAPDYSFPRSVQPSTSSSRC